MNIVKKLTSDSQIGIPPEGKMLINLPGVAYINYLSELIASKNASTYLEVGTNFGDSLAPVCCPSIAIDPDFKLNVDVVGNKELCFMYQMTSDDFFAKHSPSTILNSLIDVAFLDGMHLYEFALRDFINIEKYCHKDSYIILHDCIPPNFEMTNREGKPAMLNPAYENYWTGDVWKTMSVISENRPDLKIAYIDCPPSGLVVITNCNSSSTLLADNYDTLVSEHSPSEKDLNNLNNYLNSISLIPSQEIKPDNFKALFEQ